MTKKLAKKYANLASITINREREFTDQKVRGLNPISASRLPLSRLGQPGSISALVRPLCGMAARHRNGATAGPSRIKLSGELEIYPPVYRPPLHRVRSLRCGILSAPSCHITRRKPVGWDSTSLSKPRQGRLRGRCRIRTMNLPVSEFAL
ncbi:hypothetical protein T265_07843 [Opisthorchis viverrini]|uniref:Uncharacterized protein n=1 Tax=Opisthorchis viverrini TaxID=6198 RepID=A0A075AA76_OPIVI|nr:hypothetical protein T265_07843 [Opisthorchis viverrini]KER24474.1 hypothetical protein T265_07843 [Opisthorchis viverrini]